MAQKGSRSPGPNGWRITGTDEPGMNANSARSSGGGSGPNPATCKGMVDQRFDHIDSGRLPSTGARAYLRRPSVTCTQLPHTPPSAHSRTPAAPPPSSGRSDTPWVRWAGATPNTSVRVACRSTLVVSASQVPPPGTPGQCTSRGMWPSGSYWGTPGLPQMSAPPRISPR